MAQSRSINDYQITSFSSGELSPRLQGRIDTKSYINGCETLRNMIVLPQGGATRRPGFVLDIAQKVTTGRMFRFKGTDSVKFKVRLSVGQIEICYSDGSVAETILAAAYTADQLEIVNSVSAENMMYFFHNAVIPKTLIYNSSAAPGSRFTFADWAPIVTAWTNASGWYSTSPIVSGGYPSCGGIYEGRLTIGGSVNYPSLYHGSYAGVYDSFPYEGTPTDASAYEKRASLSGLSVMNWIIGMGPLFIGTDAGVATKSSRNELMTSLTSSFTLMASIHGASSQQGFLMGGEVFYIQNGGKKIRMAQYNSGTETYMTPDIIGHAEHIASVGIKRATYMQEPESILWLLLNDGTLASCTFDASIGMSAWSTHEADGDITDICVCGYGDSERLWIEVDRDGSLYSEYLSELLPADQEDNCFVDACVQHVAGDVLNIASLSAFSVVIGTETYYAAQVVLDSGAVADGDYVRILDSGNDDIDYKDMLVGDWDGSDTFNLYDPDDTGEYFYLDNFTTILATGTCREVTDSISGLTHLAGLEVDYSIDGGDGGTVDVTAGGVAKLNYRGNKIMIGLAYESYIIPMNVANSKSKQKRILNITIEVYKSIGGMAGQSLTLLDPIPTLEIVTLDEIPELNTGPITIPFKGGSTYNGDLVLYQGRPLPFTVLSVILEVETGE